MKVETINNSTWVVLSRRNLLTLLMKLDGYPENSACTIQGGIDAPGFFVKAEEDQEHYADRVVPPGMTPWGPMRPDTESKLSGL